MNELTTLKEGTRVCGSTQTQQSSFTPESPAPSKKPPSKRKRKCSEKPARKESFSATLHLDSIPNDEPLDPYWNEHCRGNQSAWWLPHQTVSPDQASHSSVTSSNYQVDQSNFWKKKIVPSSSMSERSLHLSLPTATPSMASAVIKGTRKIRVFPKNEPYLLELIRQHRRAYNLAVACFKESDARPELRKSEEMKKTVLRGIIREFVRDEVIDRGGEFASAGCDEAVLNAFRTRYAVIERRKKGEAADFAFRSIKDVRQGFLIQKLSPSFVLKNFDVSEKLPKEAFKKLTRIVHERGRWFICAQKHITTAQNAETQGLRVVAIDPGVRSFATSYTDDHCTTYGDGFYASKVFPLLLEIDKLIGLRARARNDQWKKHYQKRIDRKVNRAKDLINDLHKRVAFDLVSQFDVVLLPSFETQEMASKVERKIRTKTVRSMLGLAHYRFELHLKWMCKKYGKRLVICNESYTSKTRSWDGVIHSSLGGAKMISDGNIRVDRDHNGARGIMLRALYGNLGHEQAVGAP